MARTHRSRGAMVAATLLATAGLAACGDDRPAAGGCGPITREALDPAYLVHVLDDDTPVEYTSDPPTSGPHKPSPPDTGAIDRVLSRPLQVGILERGDVLVQHDPDLPPDARQRLEDLAGTDVVVAPNPDLPDAVVATAWRAKRVCGSVVLEDLEEFVTERAGQGP